VNGIYTPEGTIDKSDLWSKYQFVVRQEALKLRVRLPASVELDDLIQAGAMGLLTALDQFDPKRGIALSTFCTNRIRWSMIDELRERDWVPRRVRTNNREIASVISRLEQVNGKQATEVEIASAMDVTLHEYQQMLQDTNTSQIYSLDELQDEFFDESEHVETTEHERLNPVNALMKENLIKHVGEKINQLSERDQLLLNLYYQQELNMKEIALAFGVTETRVSQLHSQAIKRLRARLDII
jgi:RNA polymerase sigma factor for flagellar operon FliA